MSAGSDMVVIIRLSTVLFKYIFMTKLGSKSSPRVHPQMARAFSCVTRLSHYIGYIRILYVMTWKNASRVSSVTAVAEVQPDSHGFRTVPIDSDAFLFEETTDGLTVLSGAAPRQIHSRFLFQHVVVL